MDRALRRIEDGQHAAAHPDDRIGRQRGLAGVDDLRLADIHRVDRTATEIRPGHRGAVLEHVDRVLRLPAPGREGHAVELADRLVQPTELAKGAAPCNPHAAVVQLGLVRSVTRHRQGVRDDHRNGGDDDRGRG